MVLRLDPEAAITVHDAVCDSVRGIHTDDLVKFDWSWLPFVYFGHAGDG